MQQRFTVRKLASTLGLLALSLGCFVAARAQVSDYGQKQMGDVTDQLPDPVKKIQIKQNLGAQIPLDLQFRDETGKAVTLGDYLGSRPAMLSMVYYKCKILCPEEFNGLVSALTMVKLAPGKDFNIIFVSVDPTETPADAAAAKAKYVRRDGQPQTGPGWHFLTGQQPAIASLASAIGYGYAPDPGPDGKMDQFAHASAIALITPKGKIAQYYLGVEYPPTGIQTGLIAASGGTIGSRVLNILTLCYQYNPLTHKYSLMIIRIVQASCVLTVLLLLLYVGFNIRRDLRNGRMMARATTLRKTANG